MNGLVHLFWAYTLIWLGIVGYVVFLVRRLGRAEQRMTRLESEAGSRAQRSGEP